MTLLSRCLRGLSTVLREVECQVLHVGDTGQRLIVYCAAPGSPTQDAFRLLAARAQSFAGT